MLLTPAEVSQRLRVSLRMVYALMADGSITADSSALLYACLRCGSAAGQLDERMKRSFLTKDFPSVIAAGKATTKQLEFYTKMMRPARRNPSKASRLQEEGMGDKAANALRNWRNEQMGPGCLVHEFMQDDGKWDWCDVVFDAQKAYELLMGEPIEHGGVTDLIASGAAAQASYGAIAAVAAALGVDAKAFSLAIAPWMENKKNPPPPIGIAGLANAIEDSERHLAALSATVPPPLPPV